MLGYVTDIQRFSLNDGDGIRTTVFLKGCNMNCQWCHNPETITFKNNIMLYENNCIHCGHCFEACPTGANLIADDKHIIDAEKCILCGKCVEACYPEALKFSAREMSVEDVMSQVIQDKPYYDESNGGMTISGGEVFCQREFANALVDAAVENGIKVAVETNLLHDFEAIKPILSKLDMIMFDIKLIDSDKHKKYTGVENKLILENALKADRLGIPMIVRTPLIPGITNDGDNLLGIAEFVSKMKNVKYYELLNYNPLGGVKYEALRTENAFRDEKPYSDKELEDIKLLLKDYNVKIG